MKWALLITVLVTLVMVVFTTGLASPQVPGGVEAEEDKDVDCSSCSENGLVLTIIQVIIVMMFVGILLIMLFLSERVFKKKRK